MNQQPNPLVPDKLHLIEHAIDRHNVQTFADLGGFWGVLGGYSAYATERGLKGTLVDFNAEQLTHLEGKVSLLKGNFAHNDIAKQVRADCIFLFDVLLHQLNPGWEYVLKLYSEQANIFLIFNQQWVGTSKTIRLPDLGAKAFVIETPDAELTHRDSMLLWQWGITFDDLVNEMKFLGFRLDYFKNCGQAWQLPNFELHSYCFVKK